MPGRKDTAIARMVKGLRTERFPVEATGENLQAARAFAFSKWLERHHERNSDRAAAGLRLLEEPTDLSWSCKFTSLFAAAVFGGEIRGNELHQFAVVGERIVDLNEDAADVRYNPSAHVHDPAFFGSKDHIDSMRSCLPRVKGWVEEFARFLAVEPEAVPLRR